MQGGKKLGGPAEVTKECAVSRWRKKQTREQADLRRVLREERRVRLDLLCHALRERDRSDGGGMFAKCRPSGRRDVVDAAVRSRGIRGTLWGRGRVWYGRPGRQTGTANMDDAAAAVCVSGSERTAGRMSRAPRRGPVRNYLHTAELPRSALVPGRCFRVLIASTSVSRPPPSCRKIRQGQTQLRWKSDGSVPSVGMVLYWLCWGSDA